MRKTVKTLSLCFILILGSQSSFAISCPFHFNKSEKKIVFFDLGETLITAPRAKNNPKAITKTSFVPGALNHLLELAKKNIKMAIISNVPEDWGKTREERVARLKTEIKKTWKDKTPFNWAYFENRIIVPMDNAHKKPAPDMFVEAKQMAAKMGLTPIFEGDDMAEVQAAQLVGINAHQVDPKNRHFLTTSCF